MGSAKMGLNGMSTSGVQGALDVVGAGVRADAVAVLNRGGRCEKMTTRMKRR